ncbi:MAG TPA: peptidase S53, partial [Terriglobales bacterium]
MGSYSKNSHSLTSNPLFTFPGGCDQDGNCYAVSPYDFATIYNVLPLWNSGIDGTGETIAVVGRSNIVLQDVTSFRSIFNLPPPDASHLQIILNGPDPGLAGDESEADIDVQWSGAVAKNAKIDFVVSESTETTDGVDLSALYVIDNNLAPILSESFGQCELFMGTAGNAFFQNLWQQAAAQGISVFVSTGDNGSSGCDNNQGTVPQPAEDGLAISGIASTQFNVAVGGTDFNDITNPLTFWNATNDPTTGASAKGYIPETTWNNTCTNSLFGSVAGFSANAETNCNNSQLVDFVWTVGGSGGVSSCTTSNGNTPSSCTGGYSKPIWQTGAGVPSDGKRDIPDVSLFASNGFVGNFYVICEADATNGFCNINNLAGFGGTSVA